MREFKVGDVVTINKPHLSKEELWEDGWIPDMDKYDGHSGVIRRISTGQVELAVIKGSGNMYYKFKWLTYYNEEDEHIEASDISVLM